MPMQKETKMNYSFDTVIDRKGTQCVKWDSENVQADMIPLSIADMDFRCPEPVLEAMKARVDHGVFGYTLPDENYFDVVRRWFKRRFGMVIHPGEIVTSPGIVPALTTLVRILTDPGDGIIIQRPVYYPFSHAVENNGRMLINNALIHEDGHYRIDFDDLEAKASIGNTRVMILCSPHNPIGRVWTAEELNRVIEICLKNNVYLISDEIHCDLTRIGAVHLPTGFLNPSERIITCTAASKTFNIAGLQLSNIVLRSADLRKRWENDVMDRNALFGINPVSMAATMAAYEEGEPWLEELRAYLDENLAFVDRYLKEHLPKAVYRIPEGTYFAWIDLRAYESDGEKLEQLMLKKAGLVLDEGYIFGQEGAGFERLNVACPRETLSESLERMRQALLE